MAKKYRWIISTIQYPMGSHLVVTDSNADHWKDFAPALIESIKYLKEHPELNK
jgi:hypothetical protein